MPPVATVGLLFVYKWSVLGLRMAHIECAVVMCGFVCFVHGYFSIISENFSETSKAIVLLV